MGMKKIRMVKIADIKQEIFVRKTLDEDRWTQFALWIDDGVDVGRPILTEDFVVIDGRHRIRAYQYLNKKEIECEIVDIKDRIEMISEAWKANTGGALPPTQEDTEFTVSELVKNGVKVQEIAKLLGLPPSITRTYIRNINLKIKRQTLAKAASAVALGGLKPTESADRHGVPLKDLQRYLVKAPPDPKGIPQIKRRLTHQFKSLSQKNGALLGNLWKKLEDGDASEAQVFGILSHIEHLQTQGVNTISEWRQRFEKKSKST
jgi:hypothetical protein